VPDSLRGQAAIVGIGDLKPERSRPGRSAMSLLAEAAYLAIQDAGLRKEDIDGMIMEPPLAGAGSGFNPTMAEYMGIYPTWATGCDATGAAGVMMALQAAAYVNAGLARYVLCGIGTSSAPRRRAPGRPATQGRAPTETWTT
jgi:acetyl-CoA acetyltransferase